MMWWIAVALATPCPVTVRAALDLGGRALREPVKPTKPRTIAKPDREAGLLKRSAPSLRIGDTLVVSRGGEVVAINLDDELTVRWRTKVPNHGFSVAPNPLIGLGEQVGALSYDPAGQRVDILDLATGEVRHRVGLPGNLRAMASVDGDLVLMTSHTVPVLPRRDPPLSYHQAVAVVDSQVGWNQWFESTDEGWVSHPIPCSDVTRPVPTYGVTLVGRFDPSGDRVAGDVSAVLGRIDSNVNTWHDHSLWTTIGVDEEITGSVWGAKKGGGFGLLEITGAPPPRKRPTESTWRLPEKVDAELRLRGHRMGTVVRDGTYRFVVQTKGTTREVPVMVDDVHLVVHLAPWAYWVSPSGTQAVFRASYYQRFDGFAIVDLTDELSVEAVVPVQGSSHDRAAFFHRGAALLVSPDEVVRWKEGQVERLLLDAAL